jgi:eight-cysteine-cluster-containing protein
VRGDAVKRLFVIACLCACDADYSLGQNREDGPRRDAGEAADGAGPDADSLPACFIGGCSAQVCTDDPERAITSCEWLDEYACYRTARCERQADGACAWTDTPALRMCLAERRPPTDCIIGGCSNQLCADEPRGSTCEWWEEYACYRSAVCERGPDASCGWRETAELADCLERLAP